MQSGGEFYNQVARIIHHPMKTSPDHRLDIPSAFLERMSVMLGEEYPAFLNSLQLPALTGLRVNTLKISVAEFRKRSPWDLSPIPWCPAGFVANEVDHSQRPPGKHPYHAAGLYYLQEPSAMAAAEILAPQPGETVLDLSAAPGGKATHLAALMGNSGLLVTNDIHLDRYWDLAENLQRCGVINSIGTIDTPEKRAQSAGEYFDRILVDAPCSGEGMFRKGDVARREWKPELVRGCSNRQSTVLEQASRLVKPGGRLLYSTCTFSPTENESVIAHFLAKHSEYGLEFIQAAPGLTPARPDWVGLPSGDPLNRAVHIWPHRAPGEGHFMALLVKNDASAASTTYPKIGGLFKYKSWLPGLDKSARLIFDEFCCNNLNVTFDISRLAQLETFLYSLPQPGCDFSNLSVLHYGWLFGFIQKGHFRPSHHLAMGIQKDQARQSLSMTSDDQRLSAYLRGETIPDPGVDGWVLMCVDDFPLGWAKRVKNMLKNYYPHGLRRRA